MTGGLGNQLKFTPIQKGLTGPISVFLRSTVPSSFNSRKKLAGMGFNSSSVGTTQHQENGSILS